MTLSARPRRRRTRSLEKRRIWRPVCRQLAAPGQVLIGATHTPADRRRPSTLQDTWSPINSRGFAEPVTAWRVVGESTAESRLEAAHPGALNQIVGREPELGLLRRAWQQSQVGALGKWS